MESSIKKSLARERAVYNLLIGKRLNIYGLDCLMYFYQSDLFENELKEIIAKLNIKGATLEKFYKNLVENLVELGDAEWIYKFARNIKGLDLQKLAQAVINTRNMKYIHKFANDVEGAPLKDIAEGVCSLGSMQDIYFFAEKVKKAPVSTLQSEFEKRMYKTAKGNQARSYIVKFAQNVEGANLKNLERVVIDLEDPTIIYEYSTKVASSNIDKLTDAIIKTAESNSLLIQFVRNAKDLKEQQIYKLAKTIKNNGDCSEMLEIAGMYSCPSGIAKELIETAIIKQ